MLLMACFNGQQRDPSIVGQSQQIGNAAKSLGLIEDPEDLTRKVSQPELAKMYETARNSTMPIVLKRKARSFKWSCQSIFPLIRREKRDQDYKYEDSRIVRFPSMSKRTTIPMQMASQT